jgi:hypothetical protein
MKSMVNAARSVLAGNDQRGAGYVQDHVEIDDSVLVGIEIDEA